MTPPRPGAGAVTPFGNATQFFHDLTPERVLDAVEAAGHRCSGRFITLNSYENRVYQIEREDGSYVVGKFYRPGRWSREQLLEEHQFMLDLVEAEVAVAAPIPLKDGSTLGEMAGLYFVLFPRIGGRAPEEVDDEQVRRGGWQVARMHVAAGRRTMRHRLRLDPETWGDSALRWLLQEDVISGVLKERYKTVANECLSLIRPLWRGLDLQRIHGDTHLGNLLWTKEGLVFLDFDDACTGPPIQDLWMLWGGRDAWAQRRRDVLLDAYEEMAPLDRSTLKLVEPLRTLRYLHWAAWIGKRRADPAFRIAFPDFGTEGFWTRALNDLYEQRILLQELGDRPAWE